MNYFILAILVFAQFAFAHEIDITGSGQRVYCSDQEREEAERDLKKPILFAGESNRVSAQALHISIIRHGWIGGSEDKNFQLVVRLQLVSCVKNKWGELQWLYETPDSSDLAHLMIPTALFSGNIFISKFENMQFVNLDNSSSETGFVANFTIPSTKLFTKKQYAKFLNGEDARSHLILRYLYQKTSSDVRPDLSKLGKDGESRVIFGLDFLFSKQKLKKITRTKAF